MHFDVNLFFWQSDIGCCTSVDFTFSMMSITLHYMTIIARDMGKLKVTLLHKREIYKTIKVVLKINLP